jgi:hypothetical protein
MNEDMEIIFQYNRSRLPPFAGKLKNKRHTALPVYFIVELVANRLTTQQILKEHPQLEHN